MVLNTVFFKSERKLLIFSFSNQKVITQRETFFRTCVEGLSSVERVSLLIRILCIEQPSYVPPVN